MGIEKHLILVIYYNAYDKSWGDGLVSKCFSTSLKTCDWICSIKEVETIRSLRAHWPASLTELVNFSFSGRLALKKFDEE